MLCLFTSTTFSQTKEELFNLVRPSQNSNNFIYNSPRYHLTFISSTDGLNVFDGLNVRTYRQSTHNMYGYNIQSNFFEDESGLVWFSTYEALHAFDPRKDDFEYYFMINSCGDSLKENYRVFWKEGNLLYLKAGREFFAFDIERRRIHCTYGLDLSSYYHLVQFRRSMQVDIFYGDAGGFHLKRLYADGAFNSLASGPRNVNCVERRDDSSVWVGHKNGSISAFDIASKEFSPAVHISSLPVNEMGRLSSDYLGISATSGKLYYFSEKTNSVTDSVWVKHAVTKSSTRFLIDPYLDSDSTLWIGGDGTGVFYKNLRKQKFEHWLSPTDETDAVSVTKIFPLQNDHYIIFTRKFGILELDKYGHSVRHWKKLPDGENYFSVIAGTKLDESRFLFARKDNLYVLSLQTGNIIRLIPKEDYGINLFGQIEKLVNSKILISGYEKLLFLLETDGTSYSLTPYGDCQRLSYMTVYFAESADSTLFVSDDESSILVFLFDQVANEHRFFKRIPVSGGVRSLAQMENGEIYLANSTGLYGINPGNWNIVPIADKQNYLLQVLYTLLPDRYGNLWIGTNHGLIKYYTQNGESKRYSIMDGIQALEFNSHACARKEDGSMLFGGINGLNYFHPDKVKPDERPSRVMISELLINDELDSTLTVPQYMDAMRLPYSKNTLSFDFHSLDFADPEDTRVEYMLKSYDKDFLDSRTANGFARYANLPPGTYSFIVKARNSDGVLNNDPREIRIEIIPPFWMRWWFVSIVAMAIFGAGYWAVRSHYRRKLEKKNQLLREQALIIERQQAVELERTRIASEMHDDLGSGLTTIRYLSDRALKHVKDEKEITEIRNIADQSNKLVRNMSEIIWAMNSRFDNTENLVGYFRRYASEFLESHHMPLRFAGPDEKAPVVNIGGEKRRNLFLVFKEVLHNSVKYAGAESIEVRITIADHLELHIAEVRGKGFDPAEARMRGNGIYNVERRMEKMDGRITFEKLENSMDIHIVLPLTY